ncbi:hypothetical protein [Maridesulfovibrio bastinii]|uniref:hypothetical protein n=1 Tax=Maridesulfovibrio bastinii TaxID=47157 RepID=UPI0003F7E386|nr:hypothetical protein [Maridesulfovibrio bastinii]
MAEAILAIDYRKRLATQAAGGASADAAGFIALGDGGTTEAGVRSLIEYENRLALFNEIHRVPLTRVEQIDALSTTAVGMATNLAGKTISEAALLDRQGRVMAFKSFPAKAFGADETFDVSIRILF